ncbi:S24 family peptidase, partial [Rodentibacter mrazii]|uniref:S24 family peptidase n=1 Tax=Rodentibacter mrazii TaxID=1908257 RepID=UPI00117A316D
EKQKSAVENATVNNLPITQGVINSDFHNLLESLVFSDDGLIEIAKLRNTQGISMITMFNDSMSPVINKGDIILINTAHDKYAGEGIYLFIMNNEVYVRRLFQSPDGILRAKAMNEDVGSSFDIAENNQVRVTFLGKCIRVIEMKSRDL